MVEHPSRVAKPFVKTPRYPPNPNLKHYAIKRGEQLRIDMEAMRLFQNFFASVDIGAQSSKLHARRLIGFWGDLFARAS